jgi:hypothetical protein
MSWPEALELLSAELGEPVIFRVATGRQILGPVTSTWSICVGSSSKNTLSRSKSVASKAAVWHGHADSATPTATAGSCKRSPPTCPVDRRVNAIALAPVEGFRRDSDPLLTGMRNPEVQRLTKASMDHGF